jgi:catechol 2,3-dioxygenase-like lactoylglutathione lyase family enzyme
MPDARSGARREEERMLADHDVGATLPVRDLDAARSFYEDTLGLTPSMDQSPEAVLYASGRAMLLVYRSDFAGTNQATAATWAVGDQLDAVMDDLRSKGVTFEHYDLPETTREGDVHVMGDTRGAWFKDPDGNILSLVNQPG